MIDCPRCHKPVDGQHCRYCRWIARTPPPMGFDGLRAQLKPKRKLDPEAAEERAAIQAEPA